MDYEVIVGNIGTVYSGTNFENADNTYREYIELSLMRYSRASGETVTLLENGSIIKEHEINN